MNWTYSEPVFESELILDDLNSAWGGHRYFGYDLIASLKPKKVVELGTYRGTSFFAFCQAVKDKNLECTLYAIDSWKGDPHASFYGEEVYEQVKDITGKFYSFLQVHLLRMDFDQAVAGFENNSIDILHIDGYHTYEAVKSNFYSWVGKVSEKGVILLHDIKETREDFGVSRFWDELKTAYPVLEFSHSSGLGIVLKNASAISGFQYFQQAWPSYYSYLHSSRIQKQLDEIKIRSLEEKIIALQNELREKESSFSWRLTQPVRSLLDLFSFQSRKD